MSCSKLVCGYIVTNDARYDVIVTDSDCRWPSINNVEHRVSERKQAKTGRLRQTENKINPMNYVYLSMLN